MHPKIGSEPKPTQVLSSMTSITTIIQTGVAKAAKELWGIEVAPESVSCSPTRKEFVGDYSVVVFTFVKAAKKSPPQVAAELGAYLQNNLPEIHSYNVIQGFLNLVLRDSFWTGFLTEVLENNTFGQASPKHQKVMIEYSSPNTNKPLHLGHIRNILLGWSCSKILEAAGYEVVRTKVVNDRGIAICKSMLAWKLWGEGRTPLSEGIKGDHFVGDYYVLFEKKFQVEYKEWQAQSLATAAFDARKNKEQDKDVFFKEYKNTYFNEYSQLGKEAREMLLNWEAGETETVSLWKTMNGWVYEGFNKTYLDLGVTFDKIYYESETYSLGKDIIMEGLSKGVFYQKPDHSIWIDLTAEKLDHKVVMRSDGTSVYITQDIGMAHLREQEFGAQKVVYVVADEQNYHFQVLFAILKKLGEPYAPGLFHLSYGMVDLPTGKMKSREGTVVDADDLMAEVISEASVETKERGEVAGLSEDRIAAITRNIGMGALKYQMIKVTPQKRMVFDPKESVALQGNTGPYIQYPYVRIRGVVAQAEKDGTLSNTPSGYATLEPAEKGLLQQLYHYPKLIEEAAGAYDPSLIANYCYDLAKLYNKFWHDLSIFNAETPEARLFRLQLSKATGKVLAHGMGLLGIEMPERM